MPEARTSNPGAQDDSVHLTHDANAVFVIEMRRPASRNSLRLSDMARLGNLIEEAQSQGARCIVLKGSGGSFCAGRDLKETDPEKDDTLAILEAQINPVLLKLYRCGVPTLAAVEGPALGFGLGLALACDITIAAENALLGSPFRNIGAVLDSGGHFFMRERLGPHRASELIYTGRLLSGREAAALGLINRSVGALDLAEIVQAMARHIAAGPTAAFATSKAILSQARSYEEVLEMEGQGQDKALRGHDGREGIRAFQEKRKPRFIGQ